MDGPASLVVDKVGWVASGDWWQSAVNKAVFKVLWSCHGYNYLVRDLVAEVLVEDVS